MADDADFTDAFCEFLQYSVTSVDAAELLLVLLENSSQPWELHDLLALLGSSTTLSEPEAARYIDLFEAHGLIERDGAGRIVYRPSSAEIAAHARTLARLYNERPVTLIRVIYALRDTRIKSFADAFKFRR